VIAQRLAARQHQYMPASLLDSQFAALQRPGADEAALRLSVLPEPEQIIDDILQHLQASACAAP
jgi:gluconate kinase